MSTLRTVVAVFLVVAAAGAGAGSGDDAWTDAEAEIWRLEREYMERLQAEDLPALAELWHDGFVGWPSHAAAPVDRSGAEASLAPLLESVTFRSVEVRPAAIRVRGDLAVVHYFADGEVVHGSGRTQPASYRITHTWIRTDGRWQIIGGMSAQRALPPAEREP